MVREVVVAAGRFAPGHLGELTRIVPFEMVDAVLAETRTTQRRVRALPSRVVIYLLLAAALFGECGYRQVWARLVAALDGLPVATPCAAGLAAARRRIGAAPLRALLDLLRGPAAGPATRGVWWHGRLLAALDGTILGCPDTPANLAVYRKGGSGRGDTGYPLVRLLALVACGTRALLATTFGSIASGEPGYARDLLPAVRPGMLVLADRNFAVADLIGAIAGRGADLLIRVKAGRRLPVCARCGDGSWISRIGPVEVRVFTVALRAARDQVIQAAGVIDETTIDLAGTIGRQVLDHLLPDRRCRASPRVVKRAISVYAPNTGRGRLRTPSYPATISINILDPDP